MAAFDLTAERLRGLLVYDPVSGIFTARIDFRGKGCKRKTGALVGSKHNKGYWHIRLDGERYLAHRLAWLYMTGHWPVHGIDHIDRNKLNNSWKNLRDVTHTINTQNRGGVVGVTYHKGRGTWVAQITADGVRRQIESRSRDRAIENRAALKKRFHPEALESHSLNAS